jgi:hypothetical protein
MITFQRLRKATFIADIQTFEWEGIAESNICISPWPLGQVRGSTSTPCLPQIIKSGI